MIVYVYDINGYYIGEMMLQESPLEPGVYFTKENSTTIKPPLTKEGEIARFVTDAWKVEIDPRGKTYYNKKDRSERSFELGEEIDSNYTDIKPPNEPFIKFYKNKWIVDTKLKEENNKLILVNNAKSLLASTDWTQTLDNLKIKGQEWVDKWATYRSELREVIKGQRDTLPEEIT